VDSTKKPAKLQVKEVLYARTDKIAEAGRFSVLFNAIPNAAYGTLARSQEVSKWLILYAWWVP
jgi:hypothetical protein